MAAAGKKIIAIELEIQFKVKRLRFAKARKRLGKNATSMPVKFLKTARQVS